MYVSTKRNVLGLNQQTHLVYSALSQNPTLFFRIFTREDRLNPRRMSYIKMVGCEGLEPSTNRLKVYCSTD